MHSLHIPPAYARCICSLPAHAPDAPESCVLLFRPIQKGLNYVNSHTPEEIAKTIQPQFQETDVDTIATIVGRYQSQDTWKGDTIFQEESFDLLQNILEEAGELEERVPYEKLVTTEFAKTAVSEAGTR